MSRPPGRPGRRRKGERPQRPKRPINIDPEVLARVLAVIAEDIARDNPHPD
jgi:hypothetical protein